MSEGVDRVAFGVKGRLLDGSGVVPVTVVVDRLRRAKKLLSLRWKTNGTGAEGTVHVRAANGLRSVLSLLGREVNRSSLFLDTSLLILLLFVVLFDDTTHSRACVLRARRHEAKIIFSSGTRSHAYVVGILRNR